MKRLFTFALLFVVLPKAALAIDAEPIIGLYYFTNSEEKISRAETETAEGDLHFRASRDPRVVAKDLAQTEIQRGNVCLRQAEQDLQAAFRDKQILRLCHQLYKDDIPGAEREVAKQKMQADFFRCYANVEARENPGSIRMALSFRAQVVMTSRMPSSLKKAGFREEEKTLSLPVREAALGEAAGSWKEVLKNGSCTLDRNSLSAFLDRYLQQVRDAKSLVRCRNSQARFADQLARLQKQFKEYVPDEWLKDEGDGDVADLLRMPALVDNFATLPECRQHHARTRVQWEKLARLSSKIARKHDVPALDPGEQPAARALASEETEF